MTTLQEQMLKDIVESGINGLLASEVAEKHGITERKVWANFNVLKNEGLVETSKVGGRFRLYSIGEQITNKETVSKELNMVGKENDVLNLGDAIANLACNTLVEKAYPEMRKRCIEEFGMTPIVQKIQINDSEPIKLDAELPPSFSSILAYAVAGNPVMLTGPAGTGKGFLARQVAKATKAEFFEVNAVKNSYDLTGFVDANSKFVRTPFYDACKAVSEGKKAVFLFDEMDCSDPEVLKIFNEALSSLEFTFPNDEHLTFEALIILCACNTFGTGADEMYCGQQLDASTLDRFAMVRVDYNRKVEMSIARGDEELCDFIDAFRKQTEKNGLLFVASYRSLKRIVSMKGSSIPPKQVMKECFLKSMAADDLKNILNNLRESLSDNFYYKACEGKSLKWPTTTVSAEQFQLTA